MPPLFLCISGNEPIDLHDEVLPWDVQVPEGWTSHWESDQPQWMWLLLAWWSARARMHHEAVSSRARLVILVLPLFSNYSQTSLFCWTLMFNSAAYSVKLVIFNLSWFVWSIIQCLLKQHRGNRSVGRSVRAGTRAGSRIIPHNKSYFQKLQRIRVRNTLVLAQYKDC